MIRKRLKVLLSAYSCEPGKGSEPEVGWRWATGLARLHDVTVVTRSNNQQPIRDGLKAIQSPGPNFEFYDLPAVFVWLKKRGMPVAIYYFLWQVGVRWHFRKQLARFDIIHHITFNSFRQPGFWWFCPVPVLLGPLGGGQTCPWRFFRLMRGRRVAEFLRSCSVLASPALPQVLASFTAASKILVANADTERRIPGPFRHKVLRMLETGVTREAIASTPVRQPEDEKVKILWLSWLLPIKAPELAIRAFARARKANPNLHLTMAGNGPLHDNARALAAELGVGDSVDWVGKVPRNEVPTLLARHHVFMFTSLRDTSGNVLLEAMAAGLPAITLRHQGAAEIATDETAIRIQPRTIEQTVTELAQAILGLAASHETRTTKGEAAVRRIKQEFSWERKAEQMSMVYDTLVALPSSPR